MTAVIDDHYTAEAQTLTTGAEADLLKLGALRGTLTPEQAARWAVISRSLSGCSNPYNDPITGP